MEKMIGKVAVVIPSYEPEEKLVELVSCLKAQRMTPIYVINDGSGEQYQKIFNDIEQVLDGAGCLLVHNVNRGKGRALKTAFRYIIEKEPNVIGVVTADSDGQHSIESIEKIRERLLEDNSKLILGVRRFDADDIPWKSRFGNILTQKVFSYLSGCHVNDTQTGLRGIPIDFVRRLWDIPGERFEFEMRMLMEAAGKIDIEEVAIETIYDSKEHHKTHFRPVKDSIKIYSILAGTLLKYCAASLTSFILDIIAFSALCNILKPLSETLYIILSTILARILSAVCNYFINYRLVFKSENKVKKTGAQYFLLACVQMVVSAVVVDFVSKHLLMNAGEVYIKVLIDMILFFLSYYVQKKYIF